MPLFASNPFEQDVGERAGKGGPAGRRDAVRLGAVLGPAAAARACEGGAAAAAIRLSELRCVRLVGLGWESWR